MSYLFRWEERVLNVCAGLVSGALIALRTDAGAGAQCFLVFLVSGQVLITIVELLSVEEPDEGP